MEAGTLEGAGYQSPGDRTPTGGRIWRLLRDAAPERSSKPAPADAQKPAPADAPEAPRRDTALRRVFSLGVSEGVATRGDAALGELEMELALLREENARLKVERHRPPDPGRIIDRMRNLRQQPGAVQADDELSRSIIECLTLRDGLLEACQEIQQAMQGMQSRIGTLSVTVEAKDRQRHAGRPAVDVLAEDAGLAGGAGLAGTADLAGGAGLVEDADLAGDVGLELAVAERVGSGFAESAA
jgi:hypothetical protein